MVDIARPASAKRNKQIKRIVIIAIVILGASAVTYGLSQMEPAAPSVDSGTVWPDTVKRGSMLRDVRGLGTLVPEEIRFVTALRDGIIERIHVQVGDTVSTSTVIAELSNPELEQQVVDAQLALQAAEAEFNNTKAQLQAQILNQETSQSSAESDAQRAMMQYSADQELAKEGLIADITVRLSKVSADNLANRAAGERKRVDIVSQQAEAQISSAEARLQQLRATYELRKSQLDQLNIRAGTSGVLQELPIQVGQRVGVGSNLARVAEPGRLKAEIQVPETQMRDVMVGQVASIDTRNGIIPGRVVRIDPAAVNGTVKVDIRLEGELPRGARPDLSVDGRIEIERLEDVLYMSRPAYGQADSTIGIFKITPDGKEAHLVQVRLGVSAVNVIEVREGLKEGDRVILSDMSTWEGYDRVRLN